MATVATLLRAHRREKLSWSSLVVQWVKDPVLSLQWGHCCGAGSIPGPGTSACHGCGQNNKNTHINLSFAFLKEVSPGRKKKWWWTLLCSQGKILQSTLSFTGNKGGINYPDVSSS